MTTSGSKNCGKTSEVKYMVESTEFDRILEKSGQMAVGHKRRAFVRNQARGRQPGKLTKGTNLLIEQLACKDRPKNNKEAYKAKMRDLRDRRKRKD